MFCLTLPQMAWLGFYFSLTPMPRTRIKLTPVQLQLIWGTLTLETLPTEVLRWVNQKIFFSVKHLTNTSPFSRRRERKRRRRKKYGNNLLSVIFSLSRRKLEVLRQLGFFFESPKSRIRFRKNKISGSDFWNSKSPFRVLTNAEGWRKPSVSSGFIFKCMRSSRPSTWQ